MLGSNVPVEPFVIPGPDQVPVPGMPSTTAVNTSMVGAFRQKLSSPISSMIGGGQFSAVQDDMRTISGQGPPLITVRVMSIIVPGGSPVESQSLVVTENGVPPLATIIYPAAPATSFQSKLTELIVEEQLIVGAIKLLTEIMADANTVSHPGSMTSRSMTLSPGTLQDN